MKSKVFKQPPSKQAILKKREALAAKKQAKLDIMENSEIVEKEVPGPNIEVIEVSIEPVAEEVVIEPVIPVTPIEDAGAVVAEEASISGNA